MTIYEDYIPHTASMSIEELAPLLVEQIVNTCKHFSLGEPFGTLTIHLNERRTFTDPLSELALPAFATTWILETA